MCTIQNIAAILTFLRLRQELKEQRRTFEPMKEFEWHAPVVGCESHACTAMRVQLLPLYVTRVFVLLQELSAIDGAPSGMRRKNPDRGAQRSVGTLGGLWAKGRERGNSPSAP